MGRKKNPSSNPNPSSNYNAAIVVAVISLIGTITTAFFSYLSATKPSDFELSIIATQTAEVRQTAAAQVLAFNPSSNILTPPHTSTVVGSNLQITETPTDIDVTNTNFPLDVTLTVTPELTITPQPTNTPNNYIDPIAFITNYFSLINDRRYEDAWAKLSAKFKDNFYKRTDGGGYVEYVDYWNTVARVEIAFIEIQSQSNSEALVYTEILFNYKTGNTETGHVTYKLVKDVTGISWLFDPN